MGVGNLLQVLGDERMAVCDDDREDGKARRDGL